VKVVNFVSEKTQSVRLYRAGSPDEGQGFWTPSEAHARKVQPESAIHEAMLQPDFTQKTFLFSRHDPLVQNELQERSADVFVFKSEDGQQDEYVVLNPHAITVVQ
jgi:hypothetical protein